MASRARQRGCGPEMSAVCVMESSALRMAAPCGQVIPECNADGHPTPCRMRFSQLRRGRLRAGTKSPYVLKSNEPLASSVVQRRAFAGWPFAYPGCK